jgi:hypothetical protein
MIPIVNTIMPKSRFADGSATKTAPNHKSLSKMASTIAVTASGARITCWAKGSPSVDQSHSIAEPRHGRQVREPGHENKGCEHDDSGAKITTAGEHKRRDRKERVGRQTRDAGGTAGLAAVGVKPEEFSDTLASCDSSMRHRNPSNRRTGSRGSVLRSRLHRSKSGYTKPFNPY